MKEKILEILWNLNNYKYPDYDKTADDIIKLLSDSIDKVVKQLPDQYKDQISKTIKKNMVISCSCNNGLIICPGCDGVKSKHGVCAGCGGTGIVICGKCGG